MRQTCANYAPDGVLVYVHVPFCVQKCAYCAFSSQTYSPDAVCAYLELIQCEMALCAERFGRLRVDTVYVGGGTPSLLEPGQVGALFEALGRFFDLHAVMEISMEANPESVRTPGFLSVARERGVSRISLGVQSFSDAALRVLGRPHDRQTALHAVKAVREAGIAAVNLDLMWGLPGQELDDWSFDLRQALELEPEHLSCYGLTLEEDTLLTRWVERGDFSLPDEECAAQMFLCGCQMLEDHGYAQYEISNFARPGHTCVHNRGYWSGRSYVGLGPAAVSTMAGQRWTNARSLSDYSRQIGTRRLGQDVESIGYQTQIQEMIMLSLRTNAGLDLNRFQAKTGWDFTRRAGDIVEQLCSSGLARVSSSHFSLTKHGMLVSNSIIELLLEYVDSMREDTP